MELRPAVAALALTLAACGAASPGGIDDPAAEREGALTVSGNAFVFAPFTAFAEGVTVKTLERPRLTTTTDADGFFSLTGFDPGDDVTLVLSDPNFHTTQTGTWVVGDEDLSRLTFQTPNRVTYQFFAYLLGTDPDPRRCQIASTVTAVGLSMYDGVAHGVAGATVTIDPPLPAELGPVYFDEQTFPDASLSETTADGGVVWTNVPPGDYVLTAHKDGAAFTQVKARCRAGVLVNASPPWGLQAL